METIGSPTLWASFIIFVLAMLALDLGVFHKSSHEVKMKEALAWSVVWVSLALIFNAFIWHWYGSQHALEFLSGYLIEKALSVDNLFVFLVLFSYFAVPKVHQHRVLFWGILGALIMRAIFIAVGAALITKFHWIMYVFGAFLVFTGIKLFRGSDEEVHPEKNPIIKMFRRFIPMVENYRGSHFLVKENGKYYATPLLLVLVVVEATDVVFAVDSIPAVFAVTRDPFIVFTSNIFAILGLRALFFMLSGIMGKFHYLKIGLGGVLSFVGTKMLIMDFYKFPTHWSLLIIATLIGGSIAASFIFPQKEPELPQPAPGKPILPPEDKMTR